MPTPVEQLKSEYDAIALHLTSHNEISMLSDFNRSYRKVLILSAGSYFEYKVTELLSDMVRSKSGGDAKLVHFLEKQALSQRYHTLFSWGKRDQPDKPLKSASHFFKLFGDTFNSDIETEIKSQRGESAEETERKRGINDSIEAFLEIGHIRNILVHTNFAAYEYDQKTPEEIFSLYQKAESFLEYLRIKLNS